MSAAIIKTEASQKRRNFISKFLIYFFLIVITACMLLPFLWMLSSSFKLNKDVFGFPIQWIPQNPRWQNYVDIWTQIPLLTFVKNTVKHNAEKKGAAGISNNPQKASARVNPQKASARNK